MCFSVYHGRGYLKIVSRAAEISMQSAVEEVQSLPEYAEKGEVKSIMACCVYCLIMFIFLILVGHH